MSGGESGLQRGRDMTELGQPTGRRCSARACAAKAVFDLQWRNPRLHTPGRTKHWLACADHSEFLADFLRRRGFLLAVQPLDGLSSQP